MKNLLGTQFPKKTTIYTQNHGSFETKEPVETAKEKKIYIYISDIPKTSIIMFYRLSNRYKIQPHSSPMTWEKKPIKMWLKRRPTNEVKASLFQWYLKKK